MKTYTEQDGLDDILTHLHHLDLGIMTIKCNWRTPLDAQKALLAAYKAIGDAMEAVEQALRVEARMAQRAATVLGADAWPGTDIFPEGES